MKNLLLLMSALFLGCATPYQQQGWRGGYSEVDLGNGSYLITSAGNGYTPMSSVIKIAFQRAHELCPNGFITINDNQSSVQDLATTNGKVRTVTRHSYVLAVQCN